MKPRLRWIKEPNETGLARVCQGPRGAILRLFTEEGHRIKVADVSPLQKGFSRIYVGWYWVAGWNSDVPHKNTYDQPVATLEEAKAQAMAYVREHLHGAKASA